MVVFALNPTLDHCCVYGRSIPFETPIIGWFLGNRLASH